MPGFPAVARVFLLLALISFVTDGARAHAQVQPLSAALRVPGSPGTAFGGAVAGRNGKIAVGAGSSVGGPVSVIDAATGAVLQTLANPSPASDDWYGYAVAWVGDDVLVGAPLSDVAGTDRGVAYLFDGSDGTLLHTFTRPDGVAGWFGFSVAGLGDDALVGVTGVLGPNGEGAYLFDGSSGAFLHAFEDPNAGTPLAGRFGRTVVVDGSAVLIASPYGASAVYRFDATGTLLATYTDPEPGDDEEFGAAIAVIGSRVAVGEGVSVDGEVYLFGGASGAYEWTYDPPFVSDNLFFGISLAAVADNIAIGTTNGVYLYQAYPSYVPVQTVLRAPAPYTDDHDLFGRALAALDGGLIVGARSSVTVFDACGNGVATAREQCDDDNPFDGDGCSFECRLETCGTAPAVGCIAAGKSQISVRDENSIYGIKDALKWTWGGPDMDLTTLGDPLTASFSFCVYDLTEASPRVRMLPAMLSTAVRPGGYWTAFSASKYSWSGLKTGAPSGLTRFTAKSGPGGTKVQLLGAGPDLGVPDASGGSIPLAGQVTVQLRSSASPVCLTADFAAAAAKNAKGRYKNKTP